MLQRQEELMKYIRLHHLVSVVATHHCWHAFTDLF